jgi:ABC-type uncharacterized transport system permease subunit
MDRIVYQLWPQLLLLLFGVILGMWGLLLRRHDAGFEQSAQRLGRVAAGVALAWLITVSIVQRQLPMLNGGQLAFFLAVLVWMGQCYAQRRVNQRLFVLLPLTGVVVLMVFGLVLGLTPDRVAGVLVGPGVAAHVTMSLAGIALLLGCGVFGAGRAILHWHIRKRRFDAWFQRLPSLGDLDRLRHLTLVSGWVLVTASLLSSLAWSWLRPVDAETVVSHLHPMVLLVVVLTALVAADRFRWLGANNIALGCVAMSALVLALLTVSVVEIFTGGGMA